MKLRDRLLFFLTPVPKYCYFLQNAFFCVKQQVISVFIIVSHVRLVFLIDPLNVQLSSEKCQSLSFSRQERRSIYLAEILIFIRFCWVKWDEILVFDNIVTILNHPPRLLKLKL